MGHGVLRQSGLYPVADRDMRRCWLWARLVQAESANARVVDYASGRFL